MQKLFNEKKKYRISGIIFDACFLFVCLIHIFYSRFPEKTQRINANILTVEGFLPKPALEKVKNEFLQGGYNKLIITGLNFPGKYYEISMNGYLIFYPDSIPAGTQTDNLHTIEVNAFSEMGGKNRAHFNLIVNDSLIADFYAGKQKRIYSARWKGKLENIDSVMIQFDNDRADKWGDRNLYVKEIIIDHKIIIPYQYNSVYETGPVFRKRRITNNFSSNAEESRIGLIRLNIDPSDVVAVSGEGNYINNTLKSALAFRDWLKASKYDVKGINLISFGPHARRKYMIYNKILGKYYNVGRIYYPYNKYRDSLKTILNELREFFGMVYYRIILIFY
jgi:hypothetical protein